MPWKESRILDQRLQFLSSYQKEEVSVADLCREYGISRRTAYRWINRYNVTGPEGLVDRSRRPHSCTVYPFGTAKIEQPLEQPPLQKQENRLTGRLLYLTHFIDFIGS
jgi:transposase-like protein